MKPILFIHILVCNLFLTLHTIAQTVSPYVFPSNGGYTTSPTLSVSYSIGETVISTIQNSNIILSQGFQQPEIQLSTGPIIGTFCSGSSISIPFIANGIFSSSNTFIAQLSNSNGGFSNPVNIGTFVGNSSGTINSIIPLGTIGGSNYRIRVISSSPLFISPDNGTNINIVNNCSTTINLKLFIEGYFIGNSIMKPVRLNEGIGNSLSNVDLINVELHSVNFPYSVVASTTVFLHVNGEATAIFSNVNPGLYYLAIKHRNAIETWSSNPINTAISPLNYDFTIEANKAFGNNMIQLEAGVWAFYSGDVTTDNNIDLLDLSILESDVNDFSSGYLATDINGDGNVDLLDIPILENNINNFIFSNHP